MSHFDENNWISKRKTYKNKLTLPYFLEGILQKDKKILSEAITLIESEIKSDKELSYKLIDKCLPYSGNSMRIGITGVPGVGKSTFIEAFGLYLISKGKRVAVLSIDPSSSSSKGSILGDKTRMENLSKSDFAFIRPTSSGNQLGGIAKHTKEAMILCEAAGFDVVLIETVGVGQSETMVHNMVDFFLLLMLAGAGDELQGIKRGIVELADSIVITKADGDNLVNAKNAVNSYKTALHYFPIKSSGWIPKVYEYSFQNSESIERIYKLIISFFKDKNSILENRKTQEKSWMFEHLRNLMINEIDKLEGNKLDVVLRDLENNKTNAFNAAQLLYNILRNNEKDGF